MPLDQMINSVGNCNASTYLKLYCHRVLAQVRQSAKSLQRRIQFSRTTYPTKIEKMKPLACTGGPAKPGSQGLIVRCGPTRPTSFSRTASRPADIPERQRGGQSTANATLLAQEPAVEAERDAYAELVALASKQNLNRKQKVTQGTR